MRLRAHGRDHRSRWVRSGVFLGLGFTALCLLVAVQVAPAIESPADPDDRRTLMEKAREAGTVDVIVTFADVEDFDLRRLDRGSAARQRAWERRVKETGDEVLDEVRDAGGTLTRRFKITPQIALRVTPRALEALRASDDVVAIVEDEVLHPNLHVSTPQVQAAQMMDEGYDGDGQIVAVIDTGVEADHPFFEDDQGNSRVIAEGCWVTGGTLCSNGQTSMTGPGAGAPVGDHGTHVAGIAAGRPMPNNPGSGQTLAGVAPAAALMALRVCNTGSSGCAFSSQIAALEFVYQNREMGGREVASVNVSLVTSTVYSSYCSPSASVGPILGQLREIGVAVAISAGNGGSNSGVSSPACYESAIAVGSTTKSGSGTTVSSFSNHHELVDLMAPGSSIRSSVFNGGYANKSGTSMAAPHVAGAWAVLRERFPGASVGVIEKGLKETGLPATRAGTTKPTIRIADARDWLESEIRLGFLGCLTGDQAVGPGGSGACDEIPSATSNGVGSGLDGLRALTASPDGNSVYAIAGAWGQSPGSVAIAHFERDPDTGELAFESCLTGSEAVGPSGSGACEEIPTATSSGLGSGLAVPTAIAFGPSGEHVYVASPADYAIAHFQRNPQTGELTWFGCVTGSEAVGPTGSGACDEIPTATPNGADSGLHNVNSLAVVLSPSSPYSQYLFAASRGDDAIAGFGITPWNGFPEWRGCLTGSEVVGPSGSGACEEIPTATSNGVGSGLNSPAAIALGPDGISVYVAAQGDSAIAHFYGSGASSGLRWSNCVTGSEAVGPSGSGNCQEIPTATSNGVGSGLRRVDSLAVSSDHACCDYLYTASGPDDAIARFWLPLGNGFPAWGSCLTGATENGPSGSGACEEVPQASSGAANSGLNLDGSGNRSSKLAVSPDGDAVYVVAADDAAITHLARDATFGELEWRGCITGKTGPSGSGACDAAPGVTSTGANSGFWGLHALAVSPDSANVYAVAEWDDAVLRFAFGFPEP